MKSIINYKKSVIQFFILSICIILLAGAFKVSAQTLAYYKTRKINTSFIISEAGQLKKKEFYFPRFDDIAPVTTGYVVTQPVTIELVRAGLMSKPEEEELFTRVYTKNISKIRFAVPGDTCSKGITLTFNRDGFQVPVTNPLGCMAMALKSKAALAVSYTLMDSTRPFTLVIGDMWVGDNEIEKHLSPSNLFVQYPFDNAKVQQSFPSSPFDSYGQCAYFPKDQREEDFKGAVFIEDNDKPTSQLLSEIFIPLVEHYPFYGQRKVNKTAFIQSLREFIEKNKSLPLCSYVDSLNLFIGRNLKDAHFYLKSTCHDKKAEKSPIYSYEINGEFRVVGVFDDSLKTLLPIGSKILKIDNTDLYAADFKSRDVNAMLKHQPGEKVNISFVFPEGKAGELSYQVKERYKVPSNFSAGNLDVKTFGDSVAYYKINKINPELPLDFVSKLDDINTKRKLILDFRNNGGGDFLAGAQFLSYFIKGRFNYFDYENIATNRIDSVVVKENTSPFHYREDGKIVLLIDESTACIAELVVNTLKTRRNNVVIVGRSSSRGALSFIYEINLPKDNVIIATNCLDTGRFLLGKKSIEGTGIAPDIKVAINTVQDLQPYQDKVLTTAISK